MRTRIRASNAFEDVRLSGAIAGLFICQLPDFPGFKIQHYLLFNVTRSSETVAVQPLGMAHRLLWFSCGNPKLAFEAAVITSTESNGFRRTGP
jgi:hypothetical protein